ncbi:hypothetical protein SLS54_005265 [Diplodia seriata]
MWEIGGFPFIEVTDVPTCGVQIESRYSEAKASLDLPQADGPWTFSNGLSNTFRVETFNVSSPGRLQSFFIQGGQRWQAIKLLGEGSFTFCGAGMASGNDIRTIEELPGNFNSSNDMYNKIWALGVRSAQQACIASGSAPSTWEITNDGVFVRGQAPAQSSLGTEYGNYTLTFSTKIARGGTGWRVAASIQGYGQYFVLTSEYPEGTFLNTNRTLLPPSTLVANYGWSLVNQTTLETGPNLYYPLPFEVKEDKWYNITTTINATGYAVSIDGSDPIFVSNANGINSAPSTFSSGDKTSGTWGFGPFQDQQAYFTNVVVEAENGTVLYKSDLKGASVLEEHGVAANTHNVCLDGAKRDRLVWTGDYAHTQRIIAASTASTAFSTGTLAYALEWQAPNSSLYPNFSGMSASMGASPAVGGTARAGYALVDYQFLYLLAFADYHRATADSSFLATHYPQLRRLAASLAATLVDPVTGLVSIPPSLPGIFFLGPPANATAPSALFAHALARAADLASAAGDPDSAASWTETAAAVAAAVDALLWNDEAGAYAVSLDAPSNISVAATAWPILAGIAAPRRRSRAIAALDDRLRLGVGYKSDESVPDALANETALSPNLSGFLLEALMVASREAAFDDDAGSSYSSSSSSSSSAAATRSALSHLLDDLWPAMLTNDAYATGSSWEYVLPDGAPGLGPSYTSLAHPWGGAPTYVLTEHVLGVRPTAPGFATWAFEPSGAVSRDVDVEWVRGRVPVPVPVPGGGGGGAAVEAGWWRVRGGDGVRVRVCGVRGTRGVVRVPGRRVVDVVGAECVDEVV